MKIEDILDSLAIPSNARIDKRIPKKVLLDNVSFSTADKKLIQESIDEMQWVAALKATNIGVQQYRDETREYIEIAVVTVRLRMAKGQSKIIQLVHRAIPYPTFLVLSGPEGVNISLADKRFSLGTGEKIICESIQKTSDLKESNEIQDCFLKSLGLSNLPKTNLYALYRGFFIRLDALEAAQLTGKYEIPSSQNDIALLRSELASYKRITGELVTLRNQALAEKQMNRRVVINEEIKHLESTLSEAISQLEKLSGY